MMLDVSLVPSDVVNGEHSVCVLIDVIRASSTIVTLLERGCDKIALTENISCAMKNKRGERSRYLFCAENLAGNCLEGADFSPSLIGIDAMQYLRDKQVLMQTTNGTTAIHMLHNLGSGCIMIGCMRNAKAVARCALSHAVEHGMNINFVCAGRGRSTIYTIDDLYCAAKLTQYLMQEADAGGITCTLNDSAKIALHSLGAYTGAVEAFQASASGNVMMKIGCEEDIRLCAMDSIAAAVPYVTNTSVSDYITISRYEKKEASHGVKQ